VLIIDDSALMRAILTEIISSDERFVVCGAAQDPYIARDMIKTLNPDILTLDIEMPRMNGISFLRNVMRLRPMPVIMISTLTHAGAPQALEALELGAIDYIGKPTQHTDMASGKYREQVINKLVAASLANIYASTTTISSAHLASSSLNERQPKSGKICAIGSSTGGTEALKDVLMMLPKHCPPIVVAQHIPEAFSASLAKRLDGCCPMHITEAKQDQLVEPGHVYIAKGGKHLMVNKVGTKYHCHLTDDIEVNMHRPSVESLFDSVLGSVGVNAMAVMLTGMGKDGAQAMLRMREQGCYTVAQDEATSVVWGMPGAAVKLGAVVDQAALQDIASKIIDHCY